MKDISNRGSQHVQIIIPHDNNLFVVKKQVRQHCKNSQEIKYSFKFVRDRKLSTKEQKSCHEQHIITSYNYILCCIVESMHKQLVLQFQKVEHVKNHQPSKSYRYFIEANVF